MKSTFSLPSAVVALLLAGDASAYHLGGYDPRAIRNNKRQDEESLPPDFSTLPDDTLSSATTPPSFSFPTGTDTAVPSLTFVPSSGLPSGAPPFPTGVINSTAPFPTATGSPNFPGNPNGPIPSVIVDGPTSSVDCSALASSIFGSIFPYPTGGPIVSWPGPFPSGGPIPSISFGPGPGFGPSESDSPFPMPTVTDGPIIGTPTASAGPIVPASESDSVEPTSTSTFATLTIANNKRHANGKGRHGYHGGPIPSGVFPPGQGPAFPTGLFPTPTEEQIAQISHFFDVCGKGKGGGHWWFPGPGKGYGHGKGKGKGKDCDKDDDE
ncbi:hypothetical protein V8F20_011617 [Naviculisporaceae sp. PSN 640]